MVTLHVPSGYGNSDFSISMRLLFLAITGFVTRDTTTGHPTLPPNSTITTSAILSNTDTKYVSSSVDKEELFYSTKVTSEVDDVGL